MGQAQAGLWRGEVKVGGGYKLSRVGPEAGREQLLLVCGLFFLDASPQVSRSRLWKWAALCGVLLLPSKLHLAA